MKAPQRDVSFKKNQDTFLKVSILDGIGAKYSNKKWKIDNKLHMRRAVSELNLRDYKDKNKHFSDELAHKDGFELKLLNC